VASLDSALIQVAILLDYTSADLASPYAVKPSPAKSRCNHSTARKYGVTLANNNNELPAQTTVFVSRYLF
jgi:hypothetical protein